MSRSFRADRRPGRPWGDRRCPASLGVRALSLGAGLGLAQLTVGCFDSHLTGPLTDGAVTRDDGSTAAFDGAVPDAGRAEDGGLPEEGGRRDATLPMDAAGDDGAVADAGSGDGAVADAARDDAAIVDGGHRPSTALSFLPMQVLTVPAGPTLDLASDQTLEMWLRIDDGAGSIAIKGDRSTGRFHYDVHVSGDDLVVGYGTGAAINALTYPVPRHRWFHLAVTVAAVGPGILMVLYLDGIELARGTFSGDLRDAINDLDLIFGGGAFDLDEVRLWNLARQPSGIRADMHRRISAVVAGLQAYWPLEESGQIAVDRTRHGHDGVLGRLTTPDGADPNWMRDGAI